MNSNENYDIESILRKNESFYNRYRRITQELQKIIIEREELKKEYKDFMEQYYKKNTDGIRQPTLKKLFF